MYILASNFFEKDDKYVFKARNLDAFKYVFIIFENNQMIICICIRNFENSRLKPGFLYTIFICICVGRKKILNGYFVVEK